MVCVGLVGYGFCGSELGRVFHDCEGSAVVAVCDTDIRRLAEARRRYPAVGTHLDSRELVSRHDVGLVVVATPLRTRFSITRDAINAGKHVLVEVPFAENSAEGEELIDLAERRGVLLAVGHSSLFTPAICKMKELINQCELGSVEYIDSVNLNPGPMGKNVNVVRALAAHDLSIIDYLVGRDPERVVVTGSRSASNGNTDLALINLEFEGGLIAHLHVNRLSPVKVRRMIVAGEYGMVIIDDAAGNEELRVYNSTARAELGVDARNRAARRLPGDRGGDIWMPYLPPLEALAAQAEHVSSAIAHGTPLRVDGRAGLRVVRLLEACERNRGDFAGKMLLEKSAAAEPVLLGAGEMPRELSVSAGAC